MGAEEYWRFDPTGGHLYAPMLQGDRRAGRVWEPIEVTPDADGCLVGLSRALGLYLHAETNRLRFRDPDSGLWLPDPEETRNALAEARRERDAAETRAEAAEAEVAALRARLQGRDGDAGADRRDNGPR